jgi:hypothetical protein
MIQRLELVKLKTVSGIANCSKECRDAMAPSPGET